MEIEPHRCSRAWRSARYAIGARDRLHLHPRRVRHRRRPARRRDRRSRDGRPARDEHPRHGRDLEILSSSAAPAPTSAARRRRCWSRWKGIGRCRARGRRSRRSRACIGGRRSSTTSRRWPMCRSIVDAAPSWYNTHRGHRRATPGRRFSASPGRVNRPGNYELPLGAVTIPRADRDYGGGHRSAAARSKAVLPGGRLRADPDRRQAGHQARLRLGAGGRLDARLGAR